VALERADSALCPVPAVHVWGNKLELGLPLDSDGFLVRGACLIVENLEVHGKAMRCQSGHDSIVGSNAVMVIPGLERLLEDEVAVGMVSDHHILVA
jgi:hypothetical protein